MTRVDPLVAEVLEDLRPTPAEEAAMQRLVQRLEAAGQAALDDVGLQGKVRVQGSLAKGTWLRGATDADLFMLLSPEVPAEALDDLAGRVAQGLLVAPQRKYAQHPYIVGRFEELDVDLVPAYDVEAPSVKMSAVDRTPFHTEWVRKHLDEAMRDEVRLAKAWLKGIGCYGAETAVGGWSGYLVELVVAHAGSFSAWLQGLAAGPPARIAFGEDQVEDEVAPVVVVDPVDPGRNVAAALTLPTLARTRRGARAFLQSPSRAFFFPAPPRAEPAKTLHDALAGQGAVWAGLTMRPSTDRLDIVFPQFQRAARTLAKSLEDGGFPVHRHEVHEQGGRVMMQFVCADVVLPALRLHGGPHPDQPGASRFRKKWQGHPDAAGDVHEQGCRLVVSLHQRDRTPAALLARSAQASQTGKHAGKALRGATVTDDPAHVEPEWAPLVADFVLDRDPWQR